ncbi:MAG: hypothetical protein OEV44_01530 [Spirochaetota bacterium]|nr:hypothetical protein [Spirochaetota bacterium]
MKRNILFFTLFLMFNLLCHTVYSGDYKTLIDFSIFEKKIRENNTYKNVDDKFNEEIFDLKSIPQKINIFQFENEILKKQSDNPQINDILTYYSKYDKSGNYYLRDGLDNNSKEKVVELLKSVGYSFRKKIYNDPNSISAEEQIMIKDAYIPWFKVTTRDMDLDRWVIQFDSYGKQNYRSKLAEEAFSPFYEMKGKKEKMLGARIHFPLSSDDIKIDLKPSFEIYQYDQEGKLSNINNGVLNNVGDIEKIAITLGFKGEISNIAI